MIRTLENKSYVTLVSDTVIIKSKPISENINPATGWSTKMSDSTLGGSKSRFKSVMET